MEDGEVEVQPVRKIEMGDITPERTRQCGFKGVVDLLETAKHGRGANIELVEFEYQSGARS